MIGVKPLLLVLDIRGSGKQNLMERDRTEQLHLLRCGCQVTVVKSTTLGVTDGQGTGCSAPVLELDVKIRYWRRKAAVGMSNEFNN